MPGVKGVSVIFYHLLFDENCMVIHEPSFKVHGDRQLSLLALPLLLSSGGSDTNWEEIFQCSEASFPPSAYQDIH